MTEKELIEILNRCKAATKGPWKSFIAGRDHTSGDSFIMTGIEDNEDLWSKNRGTDIYLCGAISADQDFIANAKQDIPNLIAEIERLKNDTYKHYLRDLIYLLKEKISEQNKTDDFSAGIKFGYESILDLIQNQAAAFNIDLDDFGFNDFENYKYNNIG
jgi:hypothetical protein